MYMKRYLAVVVCLALCLLAAATATAQSLISGNIQGTVTDPSDAVVAGASVTLKSLDTGTTQDVTTTDTGLFRFALLKPGRYSVTVKQAGFGTIEQPVTVAVGQTSITNVKLQVSASSQTVEVSGEGVTVITAAANPSTAFTQEEVQMLPNPGGDITNIAQTAPGVVMNNTGGYGNFTVNGLPATSNLFTTNGENNMDPYFNINNTGATNLTIGSNEVQEATVLANPYSGEYGQLSGAQVTYVTKSGTNQFHGNALYWWNGSSMNSNNWMNNNSDPATPKAFSNANQWAASVGGPIWKNKTFFFVDTEGLRFVLPNVIPVTVPTTDFANAVLANVAAKQPSESGTYQQLFKLYANAPGAGAAQPIANSSYCNGIKLAGFNPATQNCAARFTSTPTALGSEWLLAFRIDQIIGQNDKLFGRYKYDKGTQPTALDPINSNFNALSVQPSWDIQIQETHTFSPNVVNEATAAGSHYVAQFQQGPQAMQTFPYQIITSGAVNFTGFNPVVSFPQGRNITQYQFIDNLSWNKGAHSFKFGGNFRRYDVSDHNFFYTNPGVYFGYVSSGLQKFADGYAYQYRRADNLASNVPIAMWGLGVYGMDEWKVKPNLTLTLALRYEYNSNPVCQINCFADFKTNWYSLPSYTSSDPGNVPYNADIQTGRHQAYQGVDGMLWSPRFGFSWSPWNDGKTVISGGFGLFYDNPAAGMVDDLLANPPVSVNLRVRPSSGTLWADPGVNGSAAIFQASAAAFNAGFSQGQTFSQIQAALAKLGVPFTAPAFNSLNTGTMHSPRWQEWNLQLQREIAKNTALVISYVGNHGIRIPYANTFLNAYDQYGIYDPGTLPGAAPVPNYSTVQQKANGGVSNYNGLTVTVRRSFTNWFSAHANYTWAHNMDDLSNGGLFTYGDSLAMQLICPQGLKACNYGSSDYDIRNNFSADFVVRPTWKFSNSFAKAALNGWEITGKMFWRSGLPLSVTDSNQAIGNYNGALLAYPAAPTSAGQGSCGSGAASINLVATPCLNSSAFVDGTTINTYPGISTQRRNQYYGPHFFDLDMSLTKNFKIYERMNFAVGLQAFNVLNHPNFSNPYHDMGDLTSFGQIDTMQPMPTSPYGTFLGFDSSVRVVQINGRLTF
jgi:hypothetical protein